MKRLFIFLLLLISISLKAQEKTNSPLFLVMKEQGAMLFERGFNQCDMAYLESVSHKDLKAYYDKGEAQNRATFIEDVKKYHCNDSTKKLIRKVDPSSLEVYALYNNGTLYGAVQSGNIALYAEEQGKPDVQTGTSKFTYVWLFEDGKWLLKEAMSFGYQGVK